MKKKTILPKLRKIDYSDKKHRYKLNFSTRKKDFFEIIIDIEVRDINHLNNIIAALRLLNEVSSLNRIKG